ncbi:MAG: hypothetical protein QJR02_01965 [Sinobacteraceae bacterium]|nr:hypothetical protein [Nevskiaceae bacterium]
MTALAAGMVRVEAQEPTTGAPRAAVVEIVDLTCSRCAGFASSVARIADVIRRDGGVFRVAPVGPVSGTMPKTPLLAVHALNHDAGDRAGQDAAAALYEGFQSGAMLDSREGLLSWLRLRGVTAADALPMDLMPDNADRFARAVALARSAGISELPALVFVRRDDGSLAGAFEWQGSAAKLEEAVLKRWDELKKP